MFYLMIFLGGIFVLLLAYILWLKATSRYSKARFAFYTIAAIVCLASTCISSLSILSVASLAAVAVNALNSLFGRIVVDPAILSPIEGGAFDKIALIALCGMAIGAIVIFAKAAIQSWEGPVTIPIADLRKEGRENDMAALFMAEITRLISGKSEIRISEKAMNWEQTVEPPPATPDQKNLFRDIFVAHHKEATIKADGWRQQSSAWVGKIFSADRHDTSDLVLLIPDCEPTAKALSDHIEKNWHEPVNKSARWFMVTDMGRHTGDLITTEQGIEIRIWSRIDLIQNGLPLNSYARELIRQFNDVTVGGTTVALKDTFVPLKVRGDGQFANLKDLLSGWVKQPGRRHLVITGEFGQGKSTGMLEFCVSWAERYLQGKAEGERIPLLIELRGKNPSEVAPAAFIAQWALRYRFDAEQTYNLIKSGNAILIFEGFDELRNAGRPFERHEHFNALWKFAFPGCKLIFTGRPNFFLNEHERNSTLRIDANKGAANNAFTEAYQILMFDIDDLAGACRAYEPVIRAGIVEKAQSHSDFCEIVLRPSMIPVVATIWPEIVAAEAAGEVISSVTLIEKYLAAVCLRKEAEIEHERVAHEVPTLGSYLLVPRAVREAATLAIVWQMAMSDSKNTITRAAFQKAIGDTFFPIVEALQGEGVSDRVVEQIKVLQARIADEEDWLDWVTTDVATAGLFVDDPAGGMGNLRLPHKQYFEYLVAKVIWLSLARPNNSLVRAIMRSATSRPLLTVLNNTAAMRTFRNVTQDDYSCFAAYKGRIIICSIFVRYIGIISVLYNYCDNILTNLSQKLVNISMNANFKADYEVIDLYKGD